MLNGRRRLLSIAGAGAALGLFLAGCKPSPPAAEEGARVPPPPASAAPGPAAPDVAPAPRANEAARSSGPRPERGALRQRRQQRRSERAERAFAAGPIAIAEAQRDKAHGRLVELDGAVEKVLRPDRKGLPHQRFVLRVAGAGTVRITHNTALGGEVPLATGERVHVRGLYEWNARGGVVHWTHHDPAGGRGGGFIRAGGKTYQ